MASKVRIEFVSEGFRAVLKSPGVSALCASIAQRRAAEKEAETHMAWKVKKGPDSYSRAFYIVKPDTDERRKLTHEEWVNEVWPVVGGPKWRPH